MASVIGITDTSTSNNRSGDREHTIVYLVDVDPAAGEGSYEAASATGLPLAGDSHPGDSQAIADSVDAQQESDDGTRFSVTVNYTNIVDDTGPDSKSSGPGSNPTNAQPSVEGWSTQMVRGPLTKARRVVTDPILGGGVTSDGIISGTTLGDFIDPIDWPSSVVDLSNNLLDESAVLNYAEEPYEEVPEMEIIVPVLTITRNESSFDHSQAFTLNNSVNSKDFSGGRPGTIRCSVSADHKFKNNQDYYEVVYKFSYNPWGHFEILEERSELIRDIVVDPDVKYKPTEKADGAIQGSKEIEGFVNISLNGMQLASEQIRSAWCYLTPYDYNTLGL